MILGLGKKKRTEQGASERGSATQKSRHEASKDSQKVADDDDRSRGSVDDSADAPHPESAEKPDSPGEVKAPTWGYTARKTLREFTDDECTDIAAALTYYAVLALFPALIAILSLLSLVGQSQETVDTTMEILTDFGGASVADTLRPTIESLATAPNGLLALVIGLATALWSASAYIMAFSRGMNRVYEIREGRPIWKLRPMMLLITLVIVLMVVAIALMLVLSGSLATTIGNTIGLGSTVLTVWTYAKWPVILILAILTVALLYYSTPNVQQPKFRWMSIGSAFAIIVWIVASIAFGFYVANFSSYSSTYGSLAGVIIFLLWLWITNVALLFGAELDAELERSRQLQGGLEAEEEIQLPARDRTKIDKLEDKEREDIRRGKALRRSSGETADPQATEKEKTGRR